MVLEVLAVWLVLSAVVAVVAALLGHGAKITAVRHGYELNR
ncbi:MAG: hypothetical protein JWN17_2006 [Frankiales bacterium]|nr:hypothetical protein [Frankiales bacterium]